MVRTSDFESGNPSSNLGRALYEDDRVVKVAVSRSAGAIRRGSNPLSRKACVAQMVEHLLCKLKVLGSIPSIGNTS